MTIAEAKPWRAKYTELVTLIYNEHTKWFNMFGVGGNFHPSHAAISYSVKQCDAQNFCDEIELKYDILPSALLVKREFDYYINNGHLMPYATPSQVIIPFDASKYIAKGKRFDVMRRDGFVCQLCGQGAKHGKVLEIDHKEARAKGGDDSMENLWTLCFDCNRGKSDKEL